jgi:hypothetical protein
VSSFYSSRTRLESYAPDLILLADEKAQENPDDDAEEAPDHAASVTAANPKPSQLCWCGSGRKFKRCHQSKKRKASADRLQKGNHSPALAL